MMKFIRAALTFAMFVALTACGGGGGSPGNVSGAALYTTAASRITIAPGEVQTYAIGGGVPGYTASSNANIATATVNGNNLVITGKTGGEVTITVTDAAGAKVTVFATVGTNVIFNTNAPAEVTVSPGGKTSNFNFLGGSGTYSASSSNTQVATVTQVGNQFFITGVNPGNASVTLADSLGATRTVSVTVGSSVPLFTTAPENLTVGIGSTTQAYTIGGGTQSYTVVSSDQSIAIATQNAATFTIKGVAAGTATITITDSSGAVKRVFVTIGSALPIITTAPTDLTVGVAVTTSLFTISGGNPGYVVTTSNQQVATVNQASNQFTISGVAPGLATITITDTVGTKKTINVSVAAAIPLFTTAPESLNVGIGATTQTFTIGGGTQSYIVVSGDTAVATVTQAGATFMVTGVSAGTTNILITDTAGASKRLSVTVGSSQPIFTTAPATVSIGVGITTNPYSISGGNPDYTVTSGNLKVATVTQTGNQYTVTGKFPGTANILITDRAGNSKSITIEVKTGVLYTTAPDALNVDVGAKSSVFTIDGGSLSYSVSTSNLGIVSVTQNGDKFYVTGVSAGLASIAITDTAGASKKIDVTVGVSTPLRSTLPSEITMSVSETTDSFTINGGAPGYTVTSSNTNVVTISQVGSQFQVTSVKPGKATISIQDSQGTTKVSNVTVSVVDFFTAAPATLNLANGTSSASFMIGGGVQAYGVSSSNSQVATVTLNGTSFIVTGVSKGTATISIFDSVGASKKIDVTVGSSVGLFTTAPTTLDLGIGSSSSSFDIGGGDPGYVVSSSNSQVALVTQTLNKFVVNGVASGKAIISVTDSFGQKVLINVTVSSGSDLYTTAPADVNIGVGLNSSTYLIGGGSKVYTVASGNSSVVEVVQNGNQFYLKGLTLGSAKVSVTDSLGATKTINVSVVNGLQLFTTAPAALTVGVGANSATYVISGGSPTYSVATSNASVVRVTQTGSQFFLTGVITGKATVVITDTVGGSKTIDVTVSTGSDLFTNAGTDISVGVGVTTSQFIIGGGSLTYSGSSANAGIATISVAGGTFTVTGVAVGKTSIFVTDTLGASKKIDVTVGSPIDLYTTSPSDLTIGIGSTTPPYDIGGGTAPYAVASSNPQVFTAAVTGNQFRVTGVSAGKANLLITDAKGATKSVSVTVGSGIDLFTTAPATVIVAVNASTSTYTIGGGSEVYSVSSSNDSVVTVGQNTNKQFIINGKAGGKAVVSVKDSAGKEVKIDVIVGSPDAMYSTAASDVNLDIGGANTYQVGGGTGVYSVGSSNTAVAQANIVGSTLVITAVGAGKATIIVRDTTTGSVSINVNVGTVSPVSLFTTAGSDIVVTPGATPTFTVGGGKAPYAVTSSNPTVITASISGSTLSLVGIAGGAAKINVTDSAGIAVVINATVNAGAAIPLYTTAPAQITIAQAVSATYVIAGGTGPYKVTSSNVAVMTASLAGSSFTLTGVTAGNAQVVVQDSLGATITRDVTISPVLAAPLDILPGNATGAVGDTLTFKIVGGSPNFTITNNNPSIATVTPTSLGAGGTFTATLLNVGSTDVNVLDSQGTTKKITITATAANSSLRISPSALVVGEDSTNNVDMTIYGGTGPYRAFTSDLVLSSVPAGSITQTPPGTIFTVGLGSQGTRCVVVKDTSGTVQIGGLYTITLTIIDSKGASATSAFSIRDNAKGGAGCL